eukprot:2767788-Karenia_brevis.AAC.1
MKKKGVLLLLAMFHQNSLSGHVVELADAADVTSFNAAISAKKDPASPIVIAPKKQLCQTCPAMDTQGTCDACGLRNCRRCQRQCLRCWAFICIGCEDLHADDCSVRRESVLFDQAPPESFE